MNTGKGDVTQHYESWDNTRQFFERIVAEFATELSYPDAEVMLVGVSAGGFGAVFNAPRLADMLPRHVRLILVDDSAPTFDSATTGARFTEAMADFYDFRSTFLADCASCGRSNWLSAWQSSVLAHYPRMIQTLLSSTKDSTISKFMTNGFPGCASGAAATPTACARCTIFPYDYGSPLHPTRAQSPSGNTVLLRDWLPALYGRTPSASDHVGLP